MKVTNPGDRVTLAFSQESVDHNETVDVPDDVGRSLVDQGWLSADDVSGLTVAELRAVAKGLGIDSSGKKDELVARIEGFEPEAETPVDDPAPADQEG